MSPAEIKAVLDWPQRGLSVYQDVVLDGQTVLTGRHDCASRWEAISPHLPAAGAILDVGSNFGWFGWKACAMSRARIVASMEADLQSAGIQRRVLASHRHERMVLLTSRADVGAMHVFAQAGQRFEAAFCLSVLHWMPDHEAFLRRLGQFCRKLFVELPDPDEAGAGQESIRRQMGPIGDYLQRLFPNRERRCLARLPSHRDRRFQREIWLVDLAHEPPAAMASGLDVVALTQLSVSWPPRSWWQSELARSISDATGGNARPIVTPQGICWQPPAHGASAVSLPQIERRIRTLPEDRLQSVPQWCTRKARGIGRRLLRSRIALAASARESP